MTSVLQYLAALNVLVALANVLCIVLNVRAWLRFTRLVRAHRVNHFAAEDNA